MKDNAETPCDKVVNYIFKLIEKQDLKIGGRLPTESYLATTLKVSRTSVREALQTLKGIGLLESSRGSGYTVKCNAREGLANVFRAIMAVKKIEHTDISEIREALETKAAELAIKRNIQPKDISELKSYVMKMETAAQKSPIDAIEYDIELHRKIAEMSCNELLTNVIYSLSNFSTHYILVSWEKINKEEIRELLNSHRKIVSLLEKGDSEQTVKEVINHYRIADQIIKNHTPKNNFEDSKSIIDKLLSDGFSSEQIYNQLYNSLSQEK